MNQILKDIALLFRAPEFLFGLLGVVAVAMLIGALAGNSI